MPKVPHDSIVSLVQRWIGKYYELLQEDPKIRATHDTHLKEVEKLNNGYLKDLARHELIEAFESQESYHNLFKTQIDFLTGVYAKEEQLNERNKLREKLRNIPNRHYKPNG